MESKLEESKTCDSEIPTDGKSDRTKSILQLFLIIGAWYGLSTSNVIASKKLLKSTEASIDIPISMILFGQYLCASMPYIASVTTKSFDKNAFKLTKDEFITGFFYFLGNLATLTSLAMTSLSLNQIIKCLEPIFTATLSVIVFQNYQNIYQNTYMLVSVVGACISAYSDLEFAWSAVILACLSNVSFASRNIYLKFSKVKEACALDQLARISACCLLIGSPYWLYLFLMRANQITDLLTNRTAATLLLGTSFSHAGYNLFSLQVLKRVENAVSHGLLNILKRPFTIIIGAFYFGGVSLTKPENRLNLLGILILIIGQVLYRIKFIPFTEKSSGNVKKIAVVVMILGTLLSTYFLVPGQTVFKGEQVFVHEDAPKYAQEISPSQNGSNSVAVIGERIFRLKETKLPTRVFPPEKLRGFASAYIKTRFYRQSANPLEKSCQNIIEEFVKSSFQVESVCKVLLLQATSEIDVDRIKSMGVATTKVYDKSQIRYMLFHTVMNHLIIPSYSIQEIKNYGKELFAKTKTINMYFFYNQKAGFSNWGDILGPMMVESLTDGLRISSNKSANSPVVFYSIGSILQGALSSTKPWFSWGTGLISKPSPQVTVNLKENQKIFSVRGTETQMAVLAVRGVFPFVAKDPALMTSRVYRLELNPKYPVCIIPHYVDHKLVLAHVPKNDKRIKVISISTSVDYKKHVLDIPRNVVQCERVLSSSLHGMIVAHSYGIPAAVIALSGGVVGGNYKYRDYYESLGIYMSRDSIRYKISDRNKLADLEYLKGLVDKTPQPAQPISIQSIIDTYPFPLTKNVKRS